jgi:hypothetical protein
MAENGAGFRANAGLAKPVHAKASGRKPLSGPEVRISNTGALPYI